MRLTASLAPALAAALDSCSLNYSSVYNRRIRGAETETQYTNAEREKIFRVALCGSGRPPRSCIVFHSLPRKFVCSAVLQAKITPETFECKITANP